MDVVSIGLGILILAVTAVDLFRTVLDYGAYGPISQRMYRLAWRLARTVAGDRPHGARAALLASTGPLMLLLSVTTWIALAAVGFALIYLPGMPEAFTFEDLPEAPIVDALYFSLISLSTVGFGDVAATTGSLRLIAALESLAGFAILTFTLSYLLGVYQVVREQSALAAFVDDGADHGGPLELAASLLRNDGTDASLTELHRELIGHNEGLYRYPLAFYFRRRDARRSALYVVRMIGEAAAFLRWVLPRRHPSSQSPALVGLLHAERRLIGDLRDRFVEHDLADVPAAHLEERWRAAADHLAAVGVDSAAPSAGDERHRRWTEFMIELESVVIAAAHELRFDSGEIGPLPASESGPQDGG